MQIPPSYKPLRRWVFQKEIKERKGRGTDQVGATRCGLPFLHAYEKRQCKNTLMNVAPGTETRHGGTTASNARQCYRTQSLRGRRRTHLRCRKHLPLSALRDSAPRFHTGSLLAPGPRLQIPRPAGSLACMDRRTRTILRFSQNLAVVFGGRPCRGRPRPDCGPVLYIPDV